MTQAPSKSVFAARIEREDPPPPLPDATCQRPRNPELLSVQGAQRREAPSLTAFRPLAFQKHLMRDRWSAPCAGWLSAGAL